MMSLDKINFILIIIIFIVLIILGIGMLRNNFISKKDNFADTSSPAWFTTGNNVLLSDSDGNLSVDTTGVLKNYIDTSISNLQGSDYNSGTTLASLQTTQNTHGTDITNMQGEGYDSGTTLASLQKAVNDLNSNAIMKYQNISLVRQKNEPNVNSNYQDITSANIKEGWGTSNLTVPNIDSSNLDGALHYNNKYMYGNWGAGDYNFIIAPPYVCDKNGLKC